MSLRLLLAAAFSMLITQPVLAQNMSKSDAATVLALHNQERARVGVAPLVWDDALSERAAEYAEHNTNATADTANADLALGQSPGENYAISNTGEQSLTSLVQEWLDEKQYYIPGGVFTDVRSSAGNYIGSYTQMIWAETTHIGCGYAIGQGSGGTDTLVCRYSFPGNIAGSYVVPPANFAAQHKFELTSTAFENNGKIPDPFTANSMDPQSPQLAWRGAPAGTKSFLITLEDLDVSTPNGFFNHWFIMNIPADAKYLSSGVPLGEVLSSDLKYLSFAGPGGEALSSVVGALQGLNSANELGYTPPAPPEGGGPHRYVFTLHAMDKVIPRGSTFELVRASVLAQTQLIGTFELP